MSYIFIYSLYFDVRAGVPPLAKYVLHDDQTFSILENTSWNSLFHKSKQDLTFLPVDIGMFSYTRFTHFSALYLENIYEFITHQ